jgi:hypothetical protein
MAQAIPRGTVIVGATATTTMTIVRSMARTSADAAAAARCSGR